MLPAGPAERAIRNSGDAASYQFLRVDWMTNDEAGTSGWA
jgi:hypothetical protein